MYSDVVIEHFTNPRSVGIIEEPTVLVKAGDPSYGDALLSFLRIEENQVMDIKYKIYGCGVAIATSAMASVLAMGRTLEEALQITNQVIQTLLMVCRMRRGTVPTLRLEQSWPRSTNFERYIYRVE